MRGVSTVPRSNGSARLIGVLGLLAALLISMLAVASAASASGGTSAATTQLIVGFTSGTSRSESASIITHNADVINASRGGPDFSPPLRDAFARAGAAGITVVVAAGNDGLSNDSSPTYPAAFDLHNLIAVAASDRRDRLASFFNYGSSVDVAAPGVEIVSTEGASTGFMSGTSMAAPHVAGIAALARSFRPGLAPQTVIDSIEAGVKKSSALTGKVRTGGVADATGTLNALGAGIAIAEAGTAPGELKWSVVAIDAEGNTTNALRSSSSNGRISVLNNKKKKR